MSFSRPTVRFEYRVNGIPENGYTVWVNGEKIGTVGKRYGPSRRQRDHGAFAFKGWGGWNLEGKLLTVTYSRDGAANAIEDDRQGVRHR